MDNKELVSLFTGYGYQVRIVENLEDIDADLHCSVSWAIGEIHKIQQAARSGKPIMKPRWPMIILRTPKVCLPIRISDKLLILNFSHRAGQDPRNCTANSSRGHSTLTRFLFRMPRRTKRNCKLFRSGCLRTVPRICSQNPGTSLKM